MATSDPAISVIYEDNHLLAVNKPAMLPTMGVESDRPSLISVCRAYIARKYQKPGNVYLGIVSRLDAPVTGVVLIARTSKAASRLSECFRSRQVRKVYLAAVQGEAAPGRQTVEHYLRKDERHRKVHTTHADCPGAQFAKLNYCALWSGRDASLLRVELETGRKHQIRVQLAKLGHPILGDRKYGAEAAFGHGIALHAYQLELEHPVRREPLALEAPLPDSWHANKRVANLLDAVF